MNGPFMMVYGGFLVSSVSFRLATCRFHGAPRCHELSQGTEPKKTPMNGGFLDQFLCEPPAGETAMAVSQLFGEARGFLFLFPGIV